MNLLSTAARDRLEHNGLKMRLMVCFSTKVRLFEVTGVGLV